MSDARIEELKTLLPRCMLADWVRLGSRLARLIRDHHHPDKHAVLLDRLWEQAIASEALRGERAANVPAPAYPADLPITAGKDEIVRAIRDHQVVVIAGETGSGKTTQIPKMCLEAGLGIEARIGCTQPRRVAALSISKRIAEELDVPWGREVGCKIRFDDRSSPHSYIKLMTDGILLAETQGDPDLADYNAIIIDEAHERSLNIDFLLGHLKGLLARRKDLKLIVTSATIDTAAFSKHFDDAPIIEVSGRVFPVAVVHRPLDEESEERGDISYVDAAVQAAEVAHRDPVRGDVLIFMPGERDIRETADLLAGRFDRDAEIIPLFGRLGADEQQRVFAPSSRRKIIVATNIAETSLTIPGIRYVIDAGLARISRYNPRTRTRRLPIEPVSQSSANQRKGRAGRVADGVCIRLYSEEDFNARPAFTQPEIQRSNLAEVILRMKAFHLGDIETFPFVQPPAPNAIANGYALLQELGALDDQRELTPLGRELARLPIDPTLGRMLLQSRRENATRELLVIAAGLSIQDPRERPAEQRDAADAAHKKFNDTRSDFLTLLHIWNAVHDEWENLRSQNQRRKFCRQHFLSYLRMREWQDLYQQLRRALEEPGDWRLNEGDAGYDAIHRCILAGLLGHVARFEERNLYRAAGNRRLSVFPGSVIHERREPARRRKPDKREPASAKSDQPRWIVAGEIVETSQLFARTLAGIDPHWIWPIAPHLCKLSHENPRWVVGAGQVLVDEKVTLHGLEVQRRKVAFGNLDAKEATRIFIQSALVEENLLPQRERDDANFATNPSDAAPQYRFLAHNRAIRQKIENWQTRVRRYDVGNLDHALAEFYARHLTNVASVNQLNRWMRDHGGPDLLCAKETDLIGELAMNYDATAFPDAVAVGGQPVALQYAYAPGEAHDGVTIRLPFTLARSVTSAALEWAVPGFREDKIAELLRSLPKTLRRELMPFPPKIAEIARDYAPESGSFLGGLSRFIRERYAVDVPESAWSTDDLPAHLRPRYEIIAPDEKPVAAGRDLDALRRELAETQTNVPAESDDWRRLARQWERFDLRTWTIDDIPARLTVSEGPGLPVYAWPGLALEEGVVNLRLFPTEQAAQRAGTAGLQRLVELELQKDLGWLEKDLRALKSLEKLYAPIGDLDELKETALLNLKRHILPQEPLPRLCAADFQAAVQSAAERIPGIGQQLMDRVEHLLKLRQEVRQKLGADDAPAKPVKGRRLNDFGQLDALVAKPPAAKDENEDEFSRELRDLLPARFLDVVPFPRLNHLPRYLKALMIRAERARLNPVKDAERAALVAPYLKQRAALRARRDTPDDARELIDELRWLIEEYKVSVFAQELGTAQPVSPKRLDALLDRIRMLTGK